MTWSNSTPDFGGCRFAMQPICGQREAAPGVVPGAAKTEPPTEGGWFLVGAFRALDTAKRRQVQATRSRIVPGTFVGRAA